MQTDHSTSESTTNFQPTIEFQQAFLNATTLPHFFTFSTRLISQLICTLSSELTQMTQPYLPQTPTLSLPVNNLTHLNTLMSWFNKWEIKINDTKSSHRYYLFSKTTRLSSLITLNNSTILHCTQVKYLGLTLDRKLTWGSASQGQTEKVKQQTLPTQAFTKIQHQHPKQNYYYTQMSPPSHLNLWHHTLEPS